MTGVKTLENLSALLRSRIVEYSYRTKTPHLGSCLSCVDILTAVYFHRLKINVEAPHDPVRDRFVLSKGHAAPALFQVLALKGFFPYEDLQKAKHDGTDYFGEHPPTPNHLPGIEAATGSLGHGLPMATGFALAAKISNLNYDTFTLVGDGECNEGSIWEAVSLAASLKLDNLTLFVDYNRWQATGRSDEIMMLDPLVQKFAAFGWECVEINGHDFGQILQALDLSKSGNGKPLAIVAKTTKGKGVSFMEDDNNWHYRTPNSDELKDALIELGQEI